MAQPTFTNPDFIDGNTADEIHERMMNNLPEDIDDMPGGFPYDFTMPAALEKDEFINFHMVRAIMIAFPQYSWDDWLDLHGQQVHLTRHAADYATGEVTFTGTSGSVIEAGTVVCVPAVGDVSAIEYATDEECTIEADFDEDGNELETGSVTVGVTAVEAGTDSNVAANSISIMLVPDKNISALTNEEAITGGTEQETDDDFYDRIEVEWDSSLTYLGNDSDYIRWAKAAGAGDCIVVSAWNGPGTVKLVLVDANGDPANDSLIEDVYNYIVSPDDRSARLLPTACAELTCVAATTVAISYVCTGLEYDDTTDLEQIAKDFAEAVEAVYEVAKTEGLLRYNDVRPLISSIAGVDDFDTFTMNGDTVNISLGSEEYPQTGTLDFS